MAEPSNKTYNYRKRNPAAPTTDALGRLSPRDTDVEAAVLGALMIEKDAYTVVCDILKPESY